MHIATILPSNWPQQITFLVTDSVLASPTEIVKSLTETVRNHLKSCCEFKFWGEDVEDIDFVVHRLPQKSSRRVCLVEMANGGNLNDNTTLGSATELASLGGSSDPHLRLPNLLIWLVECLSFRLILFEQNGPSLEFLVVGRTTALPWQKLDVIEQSAQHHVKPELGSTLEPDMRMWEPTEPFEFDDDPTDESIDSTLSPHWLEIRDNYREFRNDCAVGEVKNREHLIVIRTFRFDLFLFEGDTSPRYFTGFNEVVGWSHDSEVPLTHPPPLSMKFDKAVIRGHPSSM